MDNNVNSDDFDNDNNINHNNSNNSGIAYKECDDIYQRAHLNIAVYNYMLVCYYTLRNMTNILHSGLVSGGVKGEERGEGGIRGEEGE